MDAGTKASDNSLKHRLKENLYAINFDLRDYFPDGNAPHIDVATPEVLEKYEAIALDVFEKNRETFEAIALLYEYKANWTPDRNQVPSNSKWRMRSIVQGISSYLSPTNRSNEIIQPDKPTSLKVA
jgi:hypothetical protein